MLQGSKNGLNLPSRRVILSFNGCVFTPSNTISRLRYYLCNSGAGGDLGHICEQYEMWITYTYVINDAAIAE